MTSTSLNKGKFASLLTMMFCAHIYFFCVFTLTSISEIMLNNSNGSNMKVMITFPCFTIIHYTVHQLQFYWKLGDFNLKMYVKFYHTSSGRQSRFCICFYMYVCIHIYVCMFVYVFTVMVYYILYVLILVYVSYYVTSK